MKRTAPRIVYAGQSLKEGNGGIARVDRLIAGLLTERADAGRACVELHVFSDGGPSGAVAPRIPVSYYGGSRLRFSIGVWKSLLRPGFFIYDAAYLAKLHPPLAGRARRPCLVFMMGIEVWEQATKASIAACGRADRLVAISNFTRERARQCHGGFTGARVCWLGTEPAAVDPGAGGGAVPKAPVVLAVGRMTANEGYKGHRELIEAWPEVLRSVPAAVLEFIGKGDLLPEMQRLAQTCGVAARVRFLGFVSETQLAAAYARAAVFALPSRGEGFGLIYIEAMRHGLPVVASVHDAGAEVVRDGVTGMLVDLRMPGNLAAKVVELLTDPAKARMMGLAGQRLWREEFTYPAFKQRFGIILDDFLRIGVGNGGT